MDSIRVIIIILIAERVKKVVSLKIQFLFKLQSHIINHCTIHLYTIDGDFSSRHFSNTCIYYLYVYKHVEISDKFLKGTLIRYIGNIYCYSYYFFRQLYIINMTTARYDE